MKPRKIKLDFLNYQIAQELHDTASFENDEGFVEFNQILLEFRKQLKKDNFQEHKFDAMFFNKPYSDQAQLSTIQNKNEALELNQSGEVSNTQGTELSKIKKIVKQIVKITHPDKTIGYPQNLQDKLTSTYQHALTALKQKDYAKVINIAYTLDIQIPHVYIQLYILPATEKLNKKADIIKTKIGYVWYHLNESEKGDVLRQHLIKLGFSFTDEKIEEALKRKKPKRKVGKRPEKIHVKK